MKKTLIVLLAGLMALSMASCGKKTADTTPSTEPPATSEAVPSQTEFAKDENGEVYGQSVDNAAEQANMNKVDGEKLSSTTPEDSSLKASGTLANCDVTIDSAKVIGDGDSKIVVIAFKFKNNNSTPQSFDGFMDVTVSQDGADLRGTVVNGVEGINTLSALTNVESGQSITVQKTYMLADTENPVEVTVFKHGEESGTMLAAAFNVK